MNRICIKWVLAATLICSCLTSLSAQPTREQLAQIRVDKEGNLGSRRPHSVIASIPTKSSRLRPTNTITQSYFV